MNSEWFDVFMFWALIFSPVWLVMLCGLPRSLCRWFGHVRAVGSETNPDINGPMTRKVAYCRRCKHRFC